MTTLATHLEEQADERNGNEALGSAPAVNNVLMIACAFPPTGGPGVQRSAKFAKFLPRFGWKPFVWSAEPLAGLPRDESLAVELPSQVVVHRHAPADALEACAVRVRRLAAGTGVRGRVARAIDWRLSRYLRTRDWPDDQRRWAAQSIEVVMRLMERESIRALYSTFSPTSNHVLAMSIKQRTGLPWVADFRDLWTDDYRYREGSPARGRADLALQQTILETADAIIGVTPRQTEILARHVARNRDKFHTITNGFDPDDFAPDLSSRGHGTDATESQNTFTLAHVGRFDRYRSGESLFAGLARFVAAPHPSGLRLLLKIIGHVSDTIRTRLAELKVPSEIGGYVDHATAIQEMRRADALLLTVPDGPNGDSVIPAKLFEYLAARRPILVVGPKDGACERIVNQTSAGIAVGFDTDEIETALQQLLDWRAGGRLFAGITQEQLGLFSRVELTRRLAEVLDGITGRSGCGTHDPRRNTWRCLA